MRNTQAGITSLVGLTFAIVFVISLGVGIYIFRDYFPLFNPDIKNPKPNSNQQVSLVSSPTPLPQPPVEVPADWKSLEVKSCLISLRFPPDWEPEVYEEPSSCQVQIFRPGTGQKEYFYLITSTSAGVPDNMSLRSQFASDFVIDGVTGKVEQDVNFDPKIGADNFLVKKGGVYFGGSLNYAKTEAQARDTQRRILAAMKFTGIDSSYQSGTNDDFFEHIVQNSIYKNNVGALKTSVELYQKRAGRLPDSLEQLKDQDAAPVWESNETTQLSLYNYQKTNQDSFTISVKLHNGEDFVVKSE